MKAICGPLSDGASRLGRSGSSSSSSSCSGTSRAPSFSARSLLRDFPQLSDDDIKEALRYAADAERTRLPLRPPRWKVLVEESLSARVAQLLRSEGHDAVHVSEAGLLGTPDTVVMRTASAESWAVISVDSDLGELLSPSRGPSVVLIRHSPPAPQLQLLVVAAPEIAKPIVAGAAGHVEPRPGPHQTPVDPGEWTTRFLMRGSGLSACVAGKR